MAIQRLQGLLDKLDSFERSNHEKHLQKMSENNVEKRTDINVKQCDTILRQSVATINKRVSTMKWSDANVRQKDETSLQSDAIQWSRDSTLQQPSPSAASPKSEQTSNESSPEVPHNVPPKQHGRGAVMASSLPTSSGTHDASEAIAASKRPKAMSGALPMTAGSEQLQQITSSLQQIQSDLQTLERMHQTSQVSVQTKLKTLEGSLKSLEGKPCTNCSPQPLSASNNQQLSMLKLTNASSLADSSKFFKSMPPPKTLPQVKPAIHRPLSAGALDKSQQMSSFQTQQREACVDSRRCANGTGTVANQVGHRNSRQGSCAMCAANLLGGPNLTSRSLLKVVYNSSDSCPIHEDFAKWAFTTKQQRSLLHSQSLCGSTTFASDTPRSLPSSVASVSQDSALRELALNESYIIHKAEVHGATGGAVRRNVLSALPGSSGSAHAPVSKESAPSRDAGLSSQRTGPRAVSSNVGRHSKNFKHTPSKKGRVRDVFDFDSPESPPDAENRLPLRRLRGTKASKVRHTCYCTYMCVYDRI